MKLTGMMLLVLGIAGFAMAGTNVPELTPDSAVSAVTLLAGALVMIRARRRK